MNKVILIGHLGKDVETSGKEGNSLNFSLATSRRAKKGDEWETLTEWHNIYLNKRNDYLEQNLLKGTKVCIEGIITYRKTEKGTYCNILAHNVMILFAPKTFATADNGLNSKNDGLPF